MTICRDCRVEMTDDNKSRRNCKTQCRNCYNKQCNLLHTCKCGTRINYSIPNNKTLCRNCYIEENMGSDIVKELLDKGSSKGEKKIAKILKQQGREFKTEHTFKDQGDFNILIKRCRFDFYLPNERTIVEYHGRQHYKYYPNYFHKKGIMVFFNSITRDFIKKIYCYSKGIKFIEIRYDENIEVKLSKLS